MGRRGRNARSRSSERSALRPPARRRRRRDTCRGGYYEPIRVDAKAAERGVRARLAGAAAAGALTFISVIGMLVFDPAKFTLLALISCTVGGLIIAISLILSARREELVHQLATDLQADNQRLLSAPTGVESLLDSTPSLPTSSLTSSSSPEEGPGATDGSL